MSTAAGIDIGQSSIHISTAQGDDPKRYPVHELKLTPGWEIELSQALPPFAIVTFEPTGWHYSHPITNCITRRRPDCQLWQVEHAATKTSRENSISGNKTDRTDARALALIASQIAAGKPPRRTKPHNQAHQETLLALRLAVNAHARATRDHTRATNRYRQAAHAINPVLAKSPAYETGVSFGIITPDEMARFSRPDAMHYTSAAAIHRLATAIDPAPVHPQIRASVALAYAQMIAADQPTQAAAAQIATLLHAPPFDENAALLLTIPSANETWAAAVLVATAGATTADQFKAALGMFPQRDQSGAHDDSRSTKKGYRPAMNAIHLWTMRLLNPNATPPNPIREYFAGGEKAGGRKMTAAKAKLCRMMFGILSTRTPYTYQERN
jgi:hypothetical protein